MRERLWIAAGLVGRCLLGFFTVAVVTFKMFWPATHTFEDKYPLGIISGGGPITLPPGMKAWTPPGPPTPLHQFGTFLLNAPLVWLALGLVVIGVTAGLVRVRTFGRTPASTDRQVRLADLRSSLLV